MVVLILVYVRVWEALIHDLLFDVHLYKMYHILNINS